LLFLPLVFDGVYVYLGGCWQSTFWRLLRPKTASAALKILANGRHWLAFLPCICHFMTQNPLQKLNVNTPNVNSRKEIKL